MASQRTREKSPYLLRFCWVSGDDVGLLIYFQCVAVAAQTSNDPLHQMGNRGPLSSAMRTFVVGLFVRGHLSSLAEGAIVAGVSKPTLMRWLDVEGVDWQASRLRYLAGQHRKAIMVTEGKSVKRPSKQEMRERATRAKAEFDAKQGAAKPDT